MRVHRPLTALVAALALLLVAAAPSGAVEVGVNQTEAQNLSTADTAAHLGAQWVRVWSLWETAEPSRGRFAPDVIQTMNAAADQAKAKGLKVLMVVQRTPAWASGGAGGNHPPSDPRTFGTAMGELARRVPAVDAWELWNEEDGPEFFAGGAAPAKYTAMVKAAYPAIKAVQPDDLVITGGLVANDVDFVEGMYANGVKGYFDAVAVHTDTACLTSPPDFVYREPNGRIGRYVFTGYREVHRAMEAHGDGAKPIWMTELGWNSQSTAPNSCSTGERKGTKPLGVTEAEQAQHLTAAYRCLAADPYVQTAFWFGMQDIPGSPNAGGYGLFRSDRSAKPAAAAFGDLAGGIAPQQCGGVIDTSGPTIQVARPTDGTVFVDMLKIDARAVDGAGGAGIRGIEMWSDGKRIRYFGDGHALIKRWWPSRYWKRGKHTITFKGIDEAGNRASTTVHVTKVKRLPKVATAFDATVEHPDARTTTVTGRLTSPKAKPAVRVPGKVFVTYQKWTKVGKRMAWKTVHRIASKASRAVAVTQQVAEPGHWRVFVRYPGRKRFRKSTSKPVVFDVI